MKRVDWGVVLAMIGAFVLLVLLFVFHPFSCVNSARSSARVAPAPAERLDLQSEFESAIASAPTATGAYDSSAASQCAYSCAAKIPYKDTDLVAQPGVHDGQFTCCPVSGVVFVVDAKRPHVTVASREFVTCCESCAGNLRKAPGKFVKV